MHAHMGTFGTHCPDRLQIRLGKLLRSVIGMAHLVSAEFALTTNSTGTGHGKILHWMYFFKAGVPYHKNINHARGKCLVDNKTLDIIPQWM